MKKFVFGIAMLGGLFGPPSNPKQGKEKYDEGQYAESVTFYEFALQEYPDQRPHINFNIGQGYLRMDSSMRALSFFSQASNIGKVDPQLASLAWNQIGAIHASMPPQKESAPRAAQAQGAGEDEKPMNPLEIALEDFKNALRLDHDNETARYNYELIKRKLQQQQQQQEQEDEDKDDQQQNQDQEQKNEQDQNKQDQQEQNKEEQQQEPKQENKGNKQQQGEPKEEKMSMEQAKMLLDAMNQNEKMFLQQLQKNKQKRAPRNQGPEW